MSASPNTPWISPEGASSHPAKLLKPPESRARWPLYLLLALAVLVAAWLGRPQPQKTLAPSVTTIRAARGVIQNTRRLAGSITAKRFVNIGAPVLQGPDTGRGLTLIFLAPS